MTGTDAPDVRAAVEAALVAGGCVAAREEADLLLAASAEGAGPIDGLVDRRLQGEPLAWITGWARFCGLRVAVDPGVFVPRPHTEALAQRAASLLPPDGAAVDLCTGSGAVAVVLRAAHPDARVIATDIDPVAVACARRNGIDALEGDLMAPLDASLRGRLDVVTAVVPYVPTDELRLLPRDVVAHEPRVALDGGPDGTAVLARAARAAGGWLRDGGTVLLEIGGDQAAAVTDLLFDEGFTDARVHRDDDGQDRAIEARRGSRA
jgi:release factor glutamine methyltransferase